jgi:hypothetical protein
VGESPPVRKLDELIRAALGARVSVEPPHAR